jgi:hypothetical protein
LVVDGLRISVLQVRENQHDQETAEEWVDECHRKPSDYQSGKFWPKHLKEFRPHASHKIRKQRIPEFTFQRL